MINLNTLKFHPAPWLLILASLGLSLWVRHALVEQEALGFFCDSGGQTALCKLRWLVVQSFLHFGLGYFALFLGALAALTRSGLIGLLGGCVGVAGLVLYNWEPAALGCLLGALTLVRAQWEDYRAEHRGAQQQA